MNSLSRCLAEWTSRSGTVGQGGHADSSWEVHGPGDKVMESDEGRPLGEC